MKEMKKKEKMCRRCLEIKALSLFYLKKPYGRNINPHYSSYCKKCDNKKINEHHMKDKKKYNARKSLQRNVRVGNIKRFPCQVCGKKKVEAHHHRGYSWKNRLDVIWLCQKHHNDVHRKIKK